MKKWIPYNYEEVLQAIENKKEKYGMIRFDNNLLIAFSEEEKREKLKNELKIRIDQMNSLEVDEAFEFILGFCENEIYYTYNNPTYENMY